MALMIDVQFACGTRTPISADAEPSCPHCGVRDIARVFAPAPRFVGVGTSALIVSRELPERSIDLTTHGQRLVLKPETQPDQES